MIFVQSPIRRLAKRLLCGLLALVVASGLCMVPSTSSAQSTGKTNSKVVLRKEATKNSKALQTLPVGEKVTILETSGTWYKVRYGSFTGYLMKKYVNKASEAADASDKIEDLGSAPGIMRVGDENTDVRKLQQALKILGYYDGSIDGKYGKGTKSAVESFQKDENLEVDGYAGELTVKRIFGSCSSRTLTTQPAPGSAKSEKSDEEKTTDKGIKTEVLDWFDDNVARVIPKKAHFTIKDVKTGKTFEAVRWSGGSHMDAEPRTKEDTATLKEIYGGSWSWRRRPILIKYNGHVYAASMNGMPHGNSTINGNDFDGVFCIHFKNSKTHGSDKVDPDHQSAITQASKATW